ncbi:OmpA family protein [Sphingomonas sp. UYP23]
MIAPNGTIGRELIDWLATHDRQPRRFELGGNEFVGRKVEPTIESKARIERLATMMQAYPDVRLHVIGYTDASGDDVADKAVSSARAEWIVQALHDAGILRSRLSSEGRGGNEPITPNNDAVGRAKNQRVAIVLSVHQ